MIARLKVDQLAKYYGVKVKDLNYAEPYEIDFDKDVKASVARECVEADLFINLPKLKTHFEAGMSVCLKNLMGCLSRPRSFMHRDFNRRVIYLARAVGHSEVNLIDGIVGHERGEIHGDPVGSELLIASLDPVAADVVGAAAMGFHEGEVDHIAGAGEAGLGQAMLTQIEVRGSAIEQVKRNFCRASW